MKQRNFGLSIPTQRRLFAVHLAKTTDRPVGRPNWRLIAALFLCAALWAFALAGLVFGADLTGGGLIPGAHFLPAGPVRP